MVPTTTATPDPVPPRFVSLNRAEAWWIDKARRDPLYFMWYLSEKKPAAHHRKWVEAILTSKRVNIIAPRESGKTTVLVYFLAWLIARNPLATHFIGSVAAKQAEERLEMIREIIAHNPRFHNVFPHVFIDYKRKDNKSEFTVWTDWYDGHEIDYATYRSLVSTKGDLKNPTLYCCGIGSSQLIGRRFSGLALIDDVHSEKNSATEDLRQKVDDWFNRTFLPCVKEEGRVCVICTRWAETDQSGRLKEKIGLDRKPLWLTLEIPAIDPESGASYWPEVWSIARLDAKRVEVGEIMFQLMYLNNPLGLAGGQFKLDYLRKALPEPLPEFEEIVVSIDLAFTEKTASDYSVFTAMARDKKRNYDIYVLEMIRVKKEINQAMEELYAFCDMVFEKYGQLDAVIIDNQALSISSFSNIKIDRPDLPSKQVSLKGDKATRLNAVAWKAQRGGMWVNLDIGCYQAMCSELVAFPKVVHDDICDSLSLPLQYWGSTNEDEAGVVYIDSPYLM